MTPEQFTLKLAAVCLQYPGPEFDAVLAAVAEALPDAAAAARPALTEFVAAAGALAPIEREDRYTRAFDFQKDHALYLTFQEVGETTQRSLELVTLQTLILEAGFTPPEGELADFIPLLLEFLAEKPVDGPDENLPVRLAGAMAKIAEALVKAEPLYVPVLRAALAVLPSPGDTITADSCKLAEEDTELPYPMPYGTAPHQP